MYSIELQTVFYEYQNKNHKIKTGFKLKIFHFDIRGKLSIIRCDKINERISRDMKMYDKLKYISNDDTQNCLLCKSEFIIGKVWTKLTSNIHHNFPVSLSLTLSMFHNLFCILFQSPSLLLDVPISLFVPTKPSNERT